MPLHPTKGREALGTHHLSGWGLERGANSVVASTRMTPLPNPQHSLSEWIPKARPLARVRGAELPAGVQGQHPSLASPSP